MDVRRIDPNRPTLYCDTENTPNYWLISFLRASDLRVVCYERGFGRDLDVAAIRWLLRTYRIVTFNGIYYDMPMITAALAGYDNAALKRLNDEIIIGGIKPWEIEDEHGLVMPREIDHIDLIEPAFGEAPLKLYGGRLHSKKLQDLPYDPDQVLSPDQADEVRRYCVNDLYITRDLHKSLEPDIALREQLSLKYMIDLRSKSDAQVAEAIIKSGVQKITGQKVEKPNVRAGMTFRYQAPSFIRFSSPQCQAAFQRVLDAEFVIKPSGQPWVPAWGEPDDTGTVAGAPVVEIGQGRYRMGYGGLHSSEESIAWYTDEDNRIDDDDVASYYPEIKRKLKLAPGHIGEPYSMVYNDIVEQRLAAKRRGDKDTAQTLKIAVNGIFGKTGSKYSALYAPNVMIQVTLTGQLCLLMLIEAFERFGIPVISANTDGVLTRVPRDKLEVKARILKRWAEITGFETETNHYKAVFSRDVNNYLALKFKKGSWTETDGFKGKGAYNDATTVEAKLSKNPQGLIIIDAVRAFLEHGTPLRHTIMSCRDIRRFVSVRQVRGGATWKGDYLGKVVRWYYSTEETDCIRYKTIRYGKKDKEFFEVWGVYPEKEGAKVALTENCKPCMELPDELPRDLDFNYYIVKAIQVLKEIGYA